MGVFKTMVIKYASVVISLFNGIQNNLNFVQKQIKKISVMKWKENGIQK